MGRYPASLACLLEDDGAPNRRGPYLKKEPVNAWRTPIAYEMSDGRVRIISAGPDKTSGTPEDIVHI